MGAQEWPQERPQEQYMQLWQLDNAHNPSVRVYRCCCIKSSKVYISLSVVLRELFVPSAKLFGKACWHERTAMCGKHQFAATLLPPRHMQYAVPPPDQCTATQ